MMKITHTEDQTEAYKKALPPVEELVEVLHAICKGDKVAQAAFALRIDKIKAKFNKS